MVNASTCQTHQLAKRINLPNAYLGESCLEKDERKVRLVIIFLFFKLQWKLYREQINNYQLTSNCTYLQMLLHVCQYKILQNSQLSNLVFHRNTFKGFQCWFVSMKFAYKWLVLVYLCSQSVKELMKQDTRFYRGSFLSPERRVPEAIVC